MKKVLLAVVAVVALILGFNYVSAWRHAHAVTSLEGNRGITVWAYHPYLINPGGLVIDVRHLEPGLVRPIDVTRVFFEIAQRFKDRSFSEVRLAYGGQTRFLIRPERFQTIGQEHGVQNPIYVIRTLPDDILRPDGTRAYAGWTGGALGVLSGQMEDFADFTNRWFINPR